MLLVIYIKKVSIKEAFEEVYDKVNWLSLIQNLNIISLDEISCVGLNFSSLPNLIQSSI